MKTYQIKNRRNVIFAVIFAFIFLFVGFLTIRGKEVKAKADAFSTSTSLMFSDDVDVAAPSPGVFEITYKLYITKDAFGDGDTLFIGVDDLDENALSESVRLGYCKMSNKSEIPFKESDTNSYMNRNCLWVADVNDLQFDEYGSATITVVVETKLNYGVKIKAQTCYDWAGWKVGHTKYASSPTANAYSIFSNKGVKGDGSYQDEVIAFCKGDREELRMLNTPSMTEEGFEFIVHIPSDTVEEIEASSAQIETLEDSRVKVTRTYFVFTQTCLLTVYQSGSYVSPNGDTKQYWYTAGDNVTTNIASAYTAAYQTSLDGTLITVKIPASEDPLKEYYYFGSIIMESVTVKYSGNLNDKTIETAIESRTANYIQTSVRETALSVLETDLSITDSDRAWLQETAEITPTTEFVTVTLNYKTVNEYAHIAANTYSFNIPREHAFTPALVLETLYNLKPDYENIASLNAVFKGNYYEDGRVYNTGERIILQAKDFEYDYDMTSQTGTLDVVYSEFEYKDLSLRITNNDPNNNLVLDYYGTDVVVGDTTTTITYNYETIEENLYNSAKWLFDLSEMDFYVTGEQDGIVVTKGADALTVTFPNSKENSLMHLSLKAVGEVVEDVEYTVRYRYHILGYTNQVITEQVATSAKFTMLYSDLKAYNYTNFMQDYGEIVNNAIDLSMVDVTYCEPIDLIKNMTKNDGSGNYTCTLTVKYKYKTIFQIKNTYNNTVTYKDLNPTNLVYNAEYFVGFVPSGYRVVRITSDSDAVQISNKEDYKATTITVNTSLEQRVLLPITVEYTDEWLVSVNYFEQYKDTPFAEKKSLTTSIKLADYPDIYNLSTSDVKEITGLKEVSMWDTITVDEINVTFDKISKYTIDLTYTKAYLKQIDYEGNTQEIEVPLTSYVDWCAEYGQDWSILFLNTAEKQYFQYANDVPRDKLYGLFSVAVFEEQVSDLNYWFKKNTGDGCMTIFDQRTVKGSSLYKFFDNLTTKGVLSSVAGHIGMYFCELFNDDNAAYQSYFFYLDGTSNNAYISNGGADDAFDTDDALDNKVEDVGDTVKNWWDKTKESKWLKAAKITLAVVVAFIVICLAIWFVKKLNLFSPRDGTTVKRTSRKK